MEEEGGPASIGLNLSRPASQAVEVTYSTSIASADTAQSTDFTGGSSQTVMITSGTTGTITIPITPDTDQEGDETFTVTIENVSNARFTTGITSIPVKVTIIDNDAPVLTVSGTSVNVAEGAGSASIGLMLSKSATQDVTVTYDTILETGEYAAQATDFTARIGQTASIIRGTGTTGAIDIPITQDSSREENDETFTVLISAISGAVFSPGVTSISVQVKIIDDDELDPEPILTVKSSSINVSESAGQAEIGLVLSKASVNLVGVTYSTSIESW